MCSVSSIAETTDLLRPASATAAHPRATHADHVETESFVAGLAGMVNLLMSICRSLASLIVDGSIAAHSHCQTAHDPTLSRGQTCHGYGLCFRGKQAHCHPAKP